MDKTKITVGDVFNRANQILIDNKLPANCFSIQLVAYRNYNVKAEYLLENSSWESKPDSLKSFLNKMSVQGGWGREAIEIGLAHANSESNLSQVIIIGDAPANTIQDVDQNRDKKYGGYGEDYWRTTKFAKKTNWKVEVFLFFFYYLSLSFRGANL